MNKTTQNLLIGAAIVSVIGVSGLSTSAFAAKKNTFQCENASSCKGRGACGATKKNNECKGQGMAMTRNQATCTKLQAKNKPTGAPAAGTTAPTDAPAETK